MLTQVVAAISDLDRAIREEERLRNLDVEKYVLRLPVEKASQVLGPAFKRDGQMLRACLNYLPPDEGQVNQWARSTEETAI